MKTILIIEDIAETRLWLRETAQMAFPDSDIQEASTIRDAAAPDNSLAFLLAGAAVLIPVILIYTAHAYWVFRGKIGSGEGYH